jgi:hypothetical protein
LPLMRRPRLAFRQDLDRPFFCSQTAPAVCRRAFTYSFVKVRGNLHKQVACSFHRKPLSFES